MLFPMSPEVLHGIELGRIGRQEFQLDVAALGFDPVADQTAAMGLQPVPDDQQSAPGEMLAETFEESDNLGCADGTFDQLEVDVPERDACHRGELVPGEAVLQDRRLASGCPGSDAMGPFADPGFVYEDDGSALPGAVFFSACQRLVFQCRMAASSRWMARPLGRWQEKFSPLSNRQTPYSEYRLPLIVSIAFNPAGEDHRRFTNELHAPLLAPFRGMDGYLIRSLEHRRIRESSDVHRSSCRCRGFDFRDVCSRGRHRSICRGQEFSRP